ncbi:MAG: hypothetical protein HYX57_12980 [Chloroflexi bacterium]|nr:hypothetical protein [Chloroflexota bacterium]
MSSRTPLWLGLGLVAGGLVSLAIGSLRRPCRTARSRIDDGRCAAVGALPGPCAPGFVAGTASAPRVVAIVATPQLRFVPGNIVVKRGETLTFQQRPHWSLNGQSPMSRATVNNLSGKNT